MFSLFLDHFSKYSTLHTFEMTRNQWKKKKDSGLRDSSNRGLVYVMQPTKQGTSDILGKVRFCFCIIVRGTLSALI